MPAILMSGSSDRELMAYSSKLPGVPILSKPFKFQKLMQLLEEITAALDRLRQGNFGQCEECDAEIPKPRLHALPYARYCVECARKLEQNL